MIISVHLQLPMYVFDHPIPASNSMKVFLAWPRPSSGISSSRGFFTQKSAYKINGILTTFCPCVCSVSFYNSRVFYVLLDLTTAGCSQDLQDLRVLFLEPEDHFIPMDRAINHTHSSISLRLYYRIQTLGIRLVLQQHTSYGCPVRNRNLNSKNKFQLS